MSQRRLSPCSDTWGNDFRKPSQGVAPEQSYHRLPLTRQFLESTPEVFRTAFGHSAGLEKRIGGVDELRNQPCFPLRRAGVTTRSHRHTYDLVARINRRNRRPYAQRKKLATPKSTLNIRPSMKRACWDYSTTAF